MYNRSVGFLLNILVVLLLETRESRRELREGRILKAIESPEKMLKYIVHCKLNNFYIFYF